MAKTLDRKAPFGEIFGGESAARYEQGGSLFDFEGNEIVAAKPVAAPKPKKAAAATTDPVVLDQVAANLGEGELGDFAG